MKWTVLKWTSQKQDVTIWTGFTWSGDGTVHRPLTSQWHLSGPIKWSEADTSGQGDWKFCWTCEVCMKLLKIVKEKFHLWSITRYNYSLKTTVELSNYHLHSQQSLRHLTLNNKCLQYRRVQKPGDLDMVCKQKNKTVHFFCYMTLCRLAYSHRRFKKPYCLYPRGGPKKNKKSKWIGRIFSLKQQSILCCQKIDICSVLF